ncbi:accessory gene regulator B family protein [Clostridium sp.]|uniref:accessory gene regulator B family protein n=1 Tax=Clostridium sp. TaxID=1506 RepID=UPI00261E1C54|nr:accessory gene regulator B family protein [Clostridium sp.]
MSNTFIKKQLNFIVSNLGLTDIYEIDKIRYGLEVFYGETFKILIMIIFAILLGKLPAFMLMITLLMLIRPYIGGSHAKSYFSCMVQSNLSFITIYYLSYIIPTINIYINAIFILFFIIVARTFNPINPLRNTIVTQYKKIKFKDIVTITLIFWFIISNLFLSKYYKNCGLLIILYIFLDFLKEVYKNEKKVSC